MKILKTDLKNGEIKVKVENADDVLALKSIVSVGDFVSGSCERKIKVGKGENAKATKKKYYLKINVEKVEFSGNEIRFNGKTVEEKEDIPKGSYQTIEAVAGSEIKIEKIKWSPYHIKKIQDSSFESKQKILIVIFDREDAIFAKTKKNGFEILLELEGDVQKKAYETKKENNFFQQILDQIKEYFERHKITNIIIATPAFWKDDFMKLVKDAKLKEKMIAVSCSSVSENAFYEVLKSSALKKMLEQERAAKEIELVDEIVKQISKEGAVAYGLDEVASFIEMGNIKNLVFTDKFFNDKQQSGESKYIEEIIEKAEKNKAEITIVSSDHEGGRKLDGLGGIAALLRYKSYN